MSDVFSKLKRSQIMRAIRGKGNRSTEGQLRYRLVSAGFAGWCLHDEKVAGKPDFAFQREKVAVFVDGCFWHGCRTCRTIPKTNRDFWVRKIRDNRKRDQEVATFLRRGGWKSLRFWEHEVRGDPDRCLKGIASALQRHVPLPKTKALAHA